MSNNKQSSVEWLVEQLEKHYVKTDLKNTVVYQQAKEMHKVEIIEAWKNGDGKFDKTANEFSLKYYNEKFTDNQ